MAEDTTNTTQQLAMPSTQPNSRLHRLPQELKEMIFSLAVVSPTPIPARVHLRDAEIDADDDSDTNSNSTGDSSTSSATFTTLVKVTPRQPSLSRVDKQTRATVLRIFYTQNTFLFRRHRYQSGPLHKWLTTTAHNYAPQARQIRRVMLETTVGKTCGTTTLVGSSRTGKQHLYRVLVSERPSDEGVRVRFGADLAVMCGCAMRTAGLLKAAAPSQRGIFYHQQSSISAALSFAQDVEHELMLMSKPNCRWQFCDEEKSSACRDCGLRVHGREPMGRFLLQRTRKQVNEEAERIEREKGWEAARLEKERERARIEAENAARWEANKAELDASLALLTSALRDKMRREEMLKDKMQKEKMDRGKKQEEPPAAARCVVM